MAIGAGLLRIPVDEYRQHIDHDEKWCFACRSWKSRESFHRRQSATDGLNNECRDCMNPRAREVMRARYLRKQQALAGEA